MDKDQFWKKARSKKGVTLDECKQVGATIGGQFSDLYFLSGRYYQKHFGPMYNRYNLKDVESPERLLSIMTGLIIQK